MVNKKQESNWWKYLIVLTFLISMSCLFILIPKPYSHYETRHIILNNSNMFEKWNVVNYICDEEVKVNIYKYTNSVYASTSIIDTKGGHGECMFKIKVSDGWK